MGNACQNPLIADQDAEEIIHKDAISPDSYEDVVRGRQNKDIKHEPLAQDSDDEKLGLGKVEVADGAQEGPAPPDAAGVEVAASDATTAASSTAAEVPEQANLLSLETAPAGEAWADFGHAPPAVVAQSQQAEASGIEWSDFSGAGPSSPAHAAAAVSSTAAPVADATAAVEMEDLLLPSPAKKATPHGLEIAVEPMQDLLSPDSPPAAAAPVVEPPVAAAEVAPTAVIDLSAAPAAIDLSAAPTAVIDLSAAPAAIDLSAPAEDLAVASPAPAKATAPAELQEPAELEAAAAPSPAPVEVEARNPVEEATTPKVVVTEASEAPGAPKSPTQYFFIGDRQESLEAHPLSTEMRFSTDAVGEVVAVRAETAEAVTAAAADIAAAPVAKEPTAGADSRYAAFDEIAGTGSGLLWTNDATALAPKEEKVEALPSPPQLAATGPAIQTDVRPAATPVDASKATPLVDVQELAKKIAETEAISRALPPNVITPARGVLPEQASLLHAQALERLVTPAGGLNTMAAEQMISAMTPEQLMQMHGAVVEAFRMQTLQSRQVQTATNEGENPSEEDADATTSGLCRPEFGDLLPAFLEKNTISGLDSDGLKIPAA